MLRNPGALVYGLIAVGALLAAESPRHEGYGATLGAVAIALLAYTLAHAYSDFAKHRLEHEQPLTRAGLERALVYGLRTNSGAPIPLLVLAICWLAGVRLTTAVTAAIWTSVVMIVLVELIAGARAKLPALALLAQSVAGAIFGSLVIVLKLILH